MTRLEQREEQQEAALAVGVAGEEAAQDRGDLGLDGAPHARHAAEACDGPVVREQPASVLERVRVARLDRADARVPDVRQDDLGAGLARRRHEGIVGVGRRHPATDLYPGRVVPPDPPSMRVAVRLGAQRVVRDAEWLVRDVVRVSVLGEEAAHRWSRFYYIG